MVVATLAAAALVAAGCGSDSKSATTSPAGATTTAASAAPTSTATSDATATTGNGASSTPAAGEAQIDLPEIPADKKVKIAFETYTLSSAGAMSDTLNGLLDKFEQEHPNIEIDRRGTPVDQLLATVRREIAAGDPPDVLQAYFYMDLMANHLGAQSWNELLGDDGLAAYIDGSLTGDHPMNPNAAALGRFNGQTYVLPWVISTPTLFFNKTLFEQAGLDPSNPPTTWEEVATAAKAITDKTDADGVFTQCTGNVSLGWCYDGILRSAGNVRVSEDLKTLDFDGPEAVQVATTFQGYVKDGIMPNVSDQDGLELFLRGKLGMFLSTSAYTSTIVSSAAKNGWEMDATGLPAWGDKPVVVVNSGSGLATMATDPLQQRAAFELIAFLTSDDAYTAITSKIGYLPLRTGIVDDPNRLAPWLAQYPFVRHNLDQLEHLQPRAYPPGDNAEQITTIWRDAVNKVIFDGADAQSTLSDAQKRGVALMP